MPDTEQPDTKPDIPVAVITEIIQHAIRHAPRDARYVMWHHYEDQLKRCQRLLPDKMPWEEARAVTALPNAVAKNLIVTTLHQAPEDSFRDLIAACQAKLREMDARDNAQPQGTKQCAMPGCTATFTPQRSTATYCSPACRQRAVRARKRASQSASPSGH